jgi:post-segregation antitoxin (ccd killing protein)
MPENPKPTLRTARIELKKHWLAENRDAIASINAFIEQHGLLADRLRYRPEVK